MVRSGPPFLPNPQSQIVYISPVTLILNKVGPFQIVFSGETLVTNGLIFIQFY